MNNIIYRAGIIPYAIFPDGNVRMLFMKPSNPLYGGNQFQIAKGKVESYDDSTLCAAIREAHEELGFNEHNTESIIKLGVYLGRTTLYVCRVKDIDDFSDFGDETSEISWMSENEFIESGRALHHDIISDAMRYIINPSLA